MTVPPSALGFSTMLPRLLLAATLLAGGAAQAASDLVTTRVEGSARVSRGGGNQPLTTRMPVLGGDVLSLSGGSKVSLQLGGQGLITLARGAELQVFDARGGPPSVGRFKLLSGTVRIDSRGSKPAQDLRLNVGTLKARILGAEAVGANDAAGDTLCVLAGAIEIQTAGSDDARLDIPGSCLRRTPDGLLRNLRLDSDPPIASSLAATEGDPGTDIITLQPPPLRAGRPAPAPIIAAAAPAATPARPAAGGWTVVVLSLAQREPVEKRSQSLQDQGLPASVRAAEVKGRTVHRVTVGEFATQAQARDFARNTLGKAGIEGWISPL